MRRLIRPFVSLSLLLVLFNSSVLACGPFSMDAVFVHSVHPNYPLERFAQGQLGVVQPTYARSYLYVVYRYFSGSNFTAKEQKDLLELWKERLGYDGGSNGGSTVTDWLEVRKQVPNLPEIKQIESYRSREKPNDYDSYLNCQNDAFDTATETLKARIAKYGAQDPAVKTWTEAQDVVFSNCSEGKNIPGAVQTTDPLVRADREYQIAAANFYATNFDAALNNFEAIARDQKSPWQTTAPYLMARTLLRKASLGPDDTKSATLAKAEEQFKKVLADARLSALHTSAQGLLNLVRFKLHPAERRAELAQSLLKNQPNDNLKQELWDYTILLDGVVDSTESQKPAVPKNETDDLTNWLFTFQAEGPEAIDQSLSRWEATKGVHWLVAALAKVDGAHPKTSQLVDQALAVSPNSSAYATARFHAARLLISTGKKVQARTIVDQMIAAQLDQSALNAFIGQRMKLATSLADFLKYAPRTPAALSWNDDGRELPAENDEVAEENKKLVGRPLFDFDAANAFNQQIPLVVLKDAVKSNSLPTELQRDLAQATWLRAVMLGDYQTADELVPSLKKEVPEIVGLLNEFSTSTQPDAKLFAALYAWLKFPGIEPVVDDGIGRTGSLNEQDSYRDNWWCSYGVTNDAKPGTEPAFLTPQQLAAAKREKSLLDAAGPGPNYLSRQVIQWATRNPNDPRNAEALHLAVMTTRYGCGDKESGRWSKAAFDLLHRKYPTSSWAKKTPYWFKE